MGTFAALDVPQEETAICMVDQDGAILAEDKADLPGHDCRLAHRAFG